MDVLDSPIPNSPYGLCGRKGILKKKKKNDNNNNNEETDHAEVDVLGSFSLTVRTVSVDVKQH